MDDGAVFRTISSRIGEGLRRLEPDLHPVLDAAVGRLRIADPGLEETYSVSVAGDWRGGHRLFVAIEVQPERRHEVAAAIARVVGTVQFASGDSGGELRRWAPYSGQDLESSADEAARWATECIAAMRGALRKGRTRTRPAPLPAPQPTSRAEPGQAPLEATSPLGVPFGGAAPDDRFLRVLNALKTSRSTGAPPPVADGRREPRPGAQADRSDGTKTVAPTVRSGAGRGRIPMGADADAAWTRQLDLVASERDTARAEARRLQEEIAQQRTRILQLVGERDQLQAAVAAADGATAATTAAREQLTAAAARVGDLEVEVRRLQDAATVSALDLQQAIHETAVLEQRLEDAGRRAASQGAEIRELHDLLDAVGTREEAGGSTVNRPSADQVQVALGMCRVLDDPSVPATRSLELLGALAAVVPAPAVQERYGARLLDAGRHEDAADVLLAIEAGHLGPVGATALLRCLLRGHRCPPHELLRAVDWSLGGSDELVAGLAWMRPAEALDLTRELVNYPPLSLETWFDEVHQRLSPEQLATLFEIWQYVDPEQAVGALVEWVNAGRVSLLSPWVDEGLRTWGTTSDSPSTTVAAFSLLADRALRRQDRDSLLTIAAETRQRLGTADWADQLVRVAAALHQLRDGPGDTTALVFLVADAVRAARAAGLTGRVTHLSEAANTISPMAQNDAQIALERAMGAGTVAASTTSVVRSVFDALELARQRYPHLVVLPAAEVSARKRGIVGLQKASEALLALGDVAERYAVGELTDGLLEALQQLPGYKADIGDVSEQKFGPEYRCTLPDGRTEVLDKHINGGGKDGRIYFLVDTATQRIVVGHVGRHLSTKRDN